MPERCDRPLISIVIPIRDAASFLAACCNSVQNQTYPNWEAILVDDLSSDLSGDIAASFAERDSRFRLIRSGRRPEDPTGPWLPRNQGLRAARGCYVAFLDADDLWLPCKLSHQVELIEASNSDLCVCAYYRFSNRDGCITERRSPPKRYWQLLLKVINPIPLSTVIIKRDFMSAGFQPVSHEDYDAWKRLFKTRRIRYVTSDRALAAYRIHQHNLTGSWWQKLSMMQQHHGKVPTFNSLVSWSLFLFIQSVYLSTSLHWRLRKRSIVTVGFASARSPIYSAGGASSLRNDGGFNV
jgi:teichuronic acid biosynthesis glycosyltransferase TuaG